MHLPMAEFKRFTAIVQCMNYYGKGICNEEKQTAQKVNLRCIIDPSSTIAVGNIATEDIEGIKRSRKPQRMPQPSNIPESRETPFSSGSTRLQKRHRKSNKQGSIISNTAK